MDLNNLLKTLNSNEKFAEKNEILDVLDMLKESLVKTLDSCKKDAAEAASNFEFEKLEPIKEIKSIIDNTISEIESFEMYREDGEISSVVIKSEDKEESGIKIDDNLVELLLDSDLKFSKPKQYVLDGKVFNNDGGSWVNLMGKLANHFALKDKSKFLSFVNLVNGRKLENYRYSSVNERVHGAITPVSAVGKYLITCLDANDMGKYIKEMLVYFGYETKYKIYGIKKQNIEDNSQVEESTLSKEYHVNDYINHKKFGIGRIKKIDNDKQTIYIKFNDDIDPKCFPFDRVTTDYFVPITNEHFGI